MKKSPHQDRSVIGFWESRWTDASDGGRCFVLMF